ncbi:hypothetical protein [Rhodococcus sp. WAY2]|uniref:hypothetical protein n=1 Tax=Rhodococcus sp. WAY2 TaxID=2663121 RepID=UPI00131FE762|nr:hypothetical protein [Rhodococcus sp. WAY2]QHE73534.1 hypothetical protein GFS60_07194 [Rhodococcus sp. WAY2]
MPELTEVLTAVRSTYARDLARLHRKALGPDGASEDFHRRGGPPSFVGRSVLDRSAEVKLIASHIAFESPRELSGAYPERSVLVVTSVSGRHARTGAQAALDLVEADAWGMALAPVGFEEFCLSLGTVARSVSGSRHYRHILGPDGAVCAIYPDDRDTLRALFTKS